MTQRALLLCILILQHVQHLTVCPLNWARLALILALWKKLLLKKPLLKLQQTLQQLAKL
jgi:hypothetical protein